MAILTRSRDKEHDIVWLYGPKYPHSENAKERADGAPSPSISVASSATGGKKSILKRKTISQTLLQHSLLTNSLLKRAGAIINAQNAEGNPNFLSSNASTSHTHSDSMATLTSASSVTSESSSVVRRVGFKQSVEQAIAVERHYPDYQCDDRDDENSLLTMKPSATPRKVIRHRRTSGSEISIVHLPSTTLKSCPETAPKRSSAIQLPWFLSQSALESGPSPSISRSPSAETLRPVKSDSHNNFLLYEDDYEEDLDSTSWAQWGSKAAAGFDSSWFSRSWGDKEEQQQSTPYTQSSGVFEPFEEQGRDGRQAAHVDADMDEDEEFRMNYGLFGKVIDTVNTARDIAHVIWNVGWS